MGQAELLEALPVAVYTTDAEGRLTFYNEAAAELWGHRPELGTSRWCGSWRIYHPDGRPLPHDECPMAVALKEGRPVRGIEVVAEKPDGTRVPFLPFPTPLKDSSGRVIGAINLLVDLNERKQHATESALLAAIVASSNDAIISKTLEGTITSWNLGATRIFGYEADEMIGQPIIRIIPPELHDEEKMILGKISHGEDIKHYETVRVAKDGRRVDVSLTISPVRNASGRVIGASKVGRDITKRKEAERLQRLLTDELNHRVKNTLAMVQAIASQSLRRAKSPANFVNSFSGRIQALAEAHSLLTKRQMQGVELTDLIREQILLGTAAQNSDDNRISCSGPLLVLDAQTAVHLALVLHELATNARKHGALSVPLGRLSVSWEMRTNGGHSLFLLWQESGGPRIKTPNIHGFGTTLIEQTLRGHGGEASIQYAADGLTCQITLPLPDEARLGAAARYARPKTTPTRAISEPRESEPILAGKRILLIEDEPLVSMELESILTAAQCDVRGPAGTIEQAESLIAEAKCDAALLDVNLAGRPVDELAAALTQREIPFAFVSGYGREALPQPFRDAMLLNKPFSEEQLLATLEALLRRPVEVVQLRPRKASLQAGTAGTAKPI
jgi:PAS domain S-box-containing protein